MPRGLSPAIRNLSLRNLGRPMMFTATPTLIRGKFGAWPIQVDGNRPTRKAAVRYAVPSTPLRSYPSTRRAASVSPVNDLVQSCFLTVPLNLAPVKGRPPRPARGTPGPARPRPASNSAEVGRNGARLMGGVNSFIHRIFPTIESECSENNARIFGPVCPQ